MAYLSDYTAGTVTSAGDVIAGEGTAWQTAQFREGDIFIAAGYWAVIASVDSETQITLVDWAGPELTDTPYRLRYMSDGSRASAQARQLIDLLGGSGNLEALAGLAGTADAVPYFTGTGTMSLLTRQDITQGVRYDVQVADIAARATYDSEPAGFAVLVSDTGDGRSAIYSRVGSSGNWSDPAYITGPSITLDVTEVDEVPYGSPPDVTLTPVAGGYNLAFEIPRGMLIEPGTTTTLAPGANATVDFVPITGGYRLDIGLPKGDTGDIDGVTPFWVTRLSNDADAAAARAGLGANDASNLTAGTVPNLRFPTRLREATASISDADSINATGWYYLAHDASNGPLPSIPGYLQCFLGPGGTLCQNWYAANSNRQFTRRLWSSGEGWRSWEESTSAWEPVTDWAPVTGEPQTLVWSELTHGLYELEVEGVKPAGTSARLLMLQVRTSSAWQASAYNYSYLYAGINGDGHFGSGADGFGGGVRLCRASGGDVGVSPGSGHGWFGSIRFNPASSYMRAFDIRGGYFLVTGAPLMLAGFGNWGSNSSVVAIRLIWDSGNFANTGRTRLLKIRE